MVSTKLIAEVRKRPLLWTHHRFELGPKATELWKEVAQCVGCDDQTCRTIWKNLRSSYRNEERRARLRKENDMRKGTYDPKRNYESKWPLFKQLNFIRTVAKPQTENSTINKDNSDQILNICNSDDSDESEIEVVIEDSDQDALPEIENEFEVAKSSNTTSIDASSKESEDILSKFCNQSAIHDNKFEHLEKICIKEEPELQIDPEVYVIDSDESNTVPADKQSAKNLESLLDSRCPATQMPATFCDENSKPSKPLKTSAADGGILVVKVDEPVVKADASKLQMLEENVTTDRQNHEELSIHKLLSKDTTDYKFLVSFLPQMKKMSELQNLQFRAKMCRFALDILGPTILIDNNIMKLSTNETDSLIINNSTGSSN